jgi:hypothetical protein
MALLGSIRTPIEGNMTEFQPEHFTAEHRDWLARVDDQELISALNREVGNPGWGNARGIYLELLRTELNNRHLDLSAVGGLGAFPGKRKFTLISKRLVFADEAAPSDGAIAVPSKNAAWFDIWEFALTYNAYERRGGFDGAARVGNDAVELWTLDASLPEDLATTRAALFFEQRRYHHFGQDPKGKSAVYIRALLTRIRDISGGFVEGPPDRDP